MEAGVRKQKSGVRSQKSKPNTRLSLEAGRKRKFYLWEGILSFVLKTVVSRLQAGKAMYSELHNNN